MHTPAADGRGTQGVGAAARQVAEHASAIARLELELAQLEIKRKVAALGAGIGMLAGAGVVGLFAFGFLLATLAAALDALMPRWLALLLVSLLLLGIVGVLAAMGLKAMRRGGAPVPEQAIEEAKRTKAALQSDGAS